MEAASGWLVWRAMGYMEEVEYLRQAFQSHGCREVVPLCLKDRQK